MKNFLLLLLLFVCSVLEALKSLTDDEVETRAQQVELALQTDAQTLAARLKLRQRYRENAEKNLGSEIDRMRAAIRVSCTLI